MTAAYHVPVAAGPVSGTVRVPGSKSLTNRALVCAALATGQSTLRRPLASEDTQIMCDCLRQLGVSIQGDLADEAVILEGAAGRLPLREAELFVGNSGTTMRFLAALVGVQGGRVTIDGVDRMRERPIRPMVDALLEMGVNASCAENGCPPVSFDGDGVQGGDVSIDASTSSQFLSGLLLASPGAENGMTIEVAGDLVSQPYVDMTLHVMQAFGVDLARDSAGQFQTQPESSYRGCEFEIEPDASAASYFFALPAILGGSITVEGLGSHSCQGDMRFVKALEEMGCRIEMTSHSTTVSGRATRGIAIDMNDISDTVQTLAVVALFAEGPTRIHGVDHIRYKESDRINDLARELRRIGAAVDVLEDGLEITPQPLHGAVVETYEDHRMAMSLSLAGLRVDGLSISDPGCTAKTYPDFFEDLEDALRYAASESE